MKHLAFVSASLLLLLVAAASAAPRVEIYRPLSRPAAELLGPAQAALGSEGSASVDAGTNSLVLVGEPPAVEAALSVLERLDRPLATHVLHYESERLEELSARGIRVAWSVSAGSFRVGNVIAPPGVDLVAIRPLAEKRERRSRFAGMLRVQDGQVGRIETGEAVPIVSHVSPWHTQAGLVDVTSGFEARPQLQGDGRVRVAIMPFEGERAGGAIQPSAAGGAIRQRGAATEVTVAPGETLAIGGLEQTRSEKERGLGGAVDTERYEDWLLLLRVEVEGAAPVR